jgi:type II secretory ATPase GspE/PulE/Tfp pilus assembly ATPase PilB-like protein
MGNPYLEVTNGKNVSKVAIDQGKLMIGRHASCALVLEDTLASRNHCLIERVGNDFVLRDLDSRNGTYVNGQMVSTVVLSPQDVITIGHHQMKFILPEEGIDEVDILSAADLVEPADDEGAIVTFGAKGSDYEGAIAQLAESLPDHSFNEWDIELINARGATIHHAGPKAKPEHGEREPREAVDIFRVLLLVCFRSRASDIHIEPRNDGHQVRLRIDGTMVDVMRVPNQFGVKLTTLVKVLSDIDIAHRNTIQEGSFASRVPYMKKPGTKRRVDYRVSFAPALHGQKLVIRILDTANAPLRIADLQLPLWMYDELGAAIAQDSGMILVAGPTGSGKTTSLYSLIRSIETTRRNVVTIEDPVEIQIENVTQIPVDEAHDKGFSQLLRSVLRQDPDVLLVGEVRDGETARIAMQAAITGHLVFSTIHTKDTVGTIFRLLDLGVEPYLIGQGLHLVLAQRLARRLCPYCKKPATPTAEQRATMGEVGANVAKIFAPVGCPRCLGTGFAGRQGYFELMRMNDALRDVILSSPTMQQINNCLAEDKKSMSLRDSAYKLVADGICSFDEIQRGIGRDR